jgi:hypothetical protein
VSPFKSNVFVSKWRIGERGSQIWDKIQQGEICGEIRGPTYNFGTILVFIIAAKFY